MRRLFFTRFLEGLRFLGTASPFWKHLPKVHSRSPHEPPTVVSPFQYAPIRSGTAIEGIGDRVLEITALHGMDGTWWRPLILMASCCEANRFDLPEPTCISHSARAYAGM